MYFGMFCISFQASSFFFASAKSKVYGSSYSTCPKGFMFTCRILLIYLVYGHTSWTRLQKRWFCYAFFIFTQFKCWYLSQMDRYCHESGLILKLIKSTTTPVTMRSIAFQMGAGCILEWRMARVVEVGEAVHKNSIRKSRFARVSQVKVE